MNYLRTIYYLIFISLLSSCITEDIPDNNIYGNYQALWEVLDKHYCFFEEKKADYGLDWNEVYTKYKEKLYPAMDNKQFFEVCANMLAELKDGHVNMYAAHNTARYWKWFEDYPANFSDSLQRIYLGTNYQMASGLKYKILNDNIGYIYCGSFENAFGSGNLNEILKELAACNGLIIDIRNNGGGQLTSAEKLAGCFTNETRTGAYIAHKTGTGHNDFSTPKPINIEPAEGLRWQKKTVVITNRKSYSAANSFVMFMKSFPNVIQLGDRTGGGAGMPFSSEMPNGWGIRFSACPMYDIHMNCTEMGIDPDIKVNQSREDLLNNQDTLIEAARKWLKENQ